MPLVGFVCPDGTPTNETQRPGQRNSLDHCGKVCKTPCMTVPMLAKIWDLEQRNHHKGAYLSASSLASDSCARQTWYERRLDFYQVAKRRFWPFRGTLGHAMVEDVQEIVLPYGWIQELKMLVTLRYPDLPAPVFDEQGVWTGEYDSLRSLEIELGGTTDLANPWRRELHDMKSMADAKTMIMLAGVNLEETPWLERDYTFSKQVKDYWVLQTNIYGWMLGRTKITDAQREKFRAAGLPELPGEYFPAPTKLEIQGWSMMEVPLTGTTYTTTGRNGRSYDIESVPVFPAEAVETFVRERALQWYRWLTLGETPPVVPKNKKFMCTTCPFSKDPCPTWTGA